MEDKKLLIEELRYGSTIAKGSTITHVYALSLMEGTVNDELLWEFHPIAISADWLQSFGFVNSDASENAFRLAIDPSQEICWHGQNGELFLQSIGPGYCFLLPTKYVHQLQNLYYSLTGEELKELKNT